MKKLFEVTMQVGDDLEMTIYFGHSERKARHSFNVAQLTLEILYENLNGTYFDENNSWGNEFCVDGKTIRLTFKQR